MDPVELLVIIAVVAMLLIALYFDRSWRRRATPTIVVIQEGRLPGEPKNGLICPSCGRKFKHTITVEEELVKCPFCGNEIG